MYWRYNNYHPADQTKCICLTKDNVYMTCVAYKSAAFRGDWGWVRYDCGHTTGYDIVSHVDKYELGSYGIRHCDFIDWIYGTGCAEPRLTRVIKYVSNKASEIYGE